MIMMYRFKYNIGDKVYFYDKDRLCTPNGGVTKGIICCRGIYYQDYLYPGKFKGGYSIKTTTVPVYRVRYYINPAEYIDITLLTENIFTSAKAAFKSYN